MIESLCVQLNVIFVCSISRRKRRLWHSLARSVTYFQSYSMASFFFRVFIDLNIVSLHKKGRKELGRYPAILTSGLVNNAFIAVSLLQPATWLKFTSRHWNGFLTHAPFIITLAWRDFLAIIEKNGKLGAFFFTKISWRIVILNNKA